VWQRADNRAVVGLLVGLGSAVLQLAPALGRGYVLVRDMVFVPRLPLTGLLLGRDGVPRAVPSDLLVALLSRIVPGDVVQDVVLLLTITIAGWGAARLLNSRSVWAAAAASALYTWNPYVTERLRLGQWAVLIGYAALPWVASAAISVREGRRWSGAMLLVALGASATGGASAQLLAVVVAIPVLLWPGSAVAWWRRAGVFGIGFVVTALPWLVPSLLQPTAPPPDRVGVALFATRPDTPFGSLGSLLSLGGVWNAQVVPAGRDHLIVGLAALVVTAAACYGLTQLRGRWSDGALGGLIAAGVVGLAIAMWGVTPGARGVLEHLVADVPAAGLLRDGQRWVAPLALLLSLGLGGLTELLVQRWRWRAAVIIAVPVALLPAAAWGADGTLVAVHWPGDWQQIATASGQLPAGPVLVLPWASERGYPWNAERPQADPTDHWLPRRVVGDDALQVGHTSTAVEDPVARRIAAAATGTASLLPTLRNQGYAGVLLQRDQPGARAAAQRLTGLPVVRSSGALTLYAVPGSRRVAVRRAPLTPILVGDLLAALGLLTAVTMCVAKRTRSLKGV
jgi:hypothetical protein